MNRVLAKRIPRELRANWAKYLAILVLIAFSMFMVGNLVTSADTIITRTDEHNAANHVEDGQFTTFIPLTAEQEKQITDSGVTLEKLFSMDVTAQDGSVLRMMKLRENIDLVEIISGEYPAGENETLLERRYAEVHGLTAGSKITVAGTEYTVTGLGVSPDYDAPFQNLSDIAVSSSGFGVMFVTGSQYDAVKAQNITAQTCCYAYLLGGGMTDGSLKQMIEDFDFDYKSVDDQYYRETIDEALSKRTEIEDAVDKLADGAADLKEGLSDLSDGADDLSKGLSDIAQGASNLAEGIAQANAAGFIPAPLAELVTGSAKLSAGADSADEGAAKLSDGAKEAADGAADLSDGMNEFREKADELLDEVFDLDLANLTMFVKRADNVRIAGAAGDVEMNRTAGLLAGVIILVMLTYVISVFIVHQIQRESSVIGALYALGAKKGVLIRHYITLPTIVAFIGGAIGTALSVLPACIEYQMADTKAYYSIPDFAPYIPIYVIVYTLIAPPVISAIVNAAVINKKLSRTALSLMRNEQSSHGYSRMEIKHGSFITKFRMRQILREMRTSIAVVASMLVCLMILMLGLDCYYICTNVTTDTQAGTTYQYMYTYKYPTKEAPEGGEPLFVKSLSKEQMGYTLDISVIGIDDDNPYYGVKPVSGKTTVVASRSVSSRYGVGSGDKLILTDEAAGMDYAFTVDSVCDYAAGLSVFMDIGSMRELFGEDEDYFNAVLSDKPLDIEEGRLYSVTTKEDIDRSSEVFTEIMSGMITTLIAVAALIFVVVMYLMSGIMIDRAAFGISLVKIFGYGKRDVKKLYLSGNAYTVGIGGLISIPLAKLAMDAIYPALVPNIACGINLSFPWYMYLIIYAGVMAVYFITSALLSGKLNRITPAEVLKNRE